MHSKPVEGSRSLSGAERTFRTRRTGSSAGSRASGNPRSHAPHAFLGLPRVDRHLPPNSSSALPPVGRLKTRSSRCSDRPQTHTMAMNAAHAPTVPTTATRSPVVCLLAVRPNRCVHSPPAHTRNAAQIMFGTRGSSWMLRCMRTGQWTESVSVCRG